MKINIIIPCGIMDLKDEIEIDRLKRFQLQLQNIKEIPNKTDNINWIFCEFCIDNPKLENTIKQYLPDAKYCAYRSKNKFNQIACWYFVNSNFSDYDFSIFSHSDILFSKNLYTVLNKRIKDKNTNYYSFRMNTFINNINVLDLELGQQQITVDDLGMKYILESNNIEYINSFNVNTYRPIKIDSMLNQKQLSDYFVKENNQISESFICLSKESFKKLDLSPDVSYHNDVVVRDLSIIAGIKYEWIHDEICLIHMLGKDLYKSISDDFDTTFEILKYYPELAHFGLFRFHPKYIPFIVENKLNVKAIYENYITKDIHRNKTYEKKLKELF